MGLLRWMRGDSDSPSSAMLAAGLGELSGILSPGKRKQTELIQELHNKRLDVSNGAPAGVDLDKGVAVIRARRDTTDTPAGAEPADTAPAPAAEVTAPTAPAAD